MGDKSEVTYKGSPLQNQMAGLVMPSLEKAFGGAMQGDQNQNLWNIPKYNVPYAPKTTPYNVNNYAIEGWKPGGGGKGGSGIAPIGGVPGSIPGPTGGGKGGSGINPPNAGSNFSLMGGENMEALNQISQNRLAQHQLAQTGSNGNMMGFKSTSGGGKGGVGGNVPIGGGIGSSDNISGTNAPLGYNVPGISGLMPNTGWYQNLDPNIQQSMMEPTNVAAREMLNVMGGQGQMSARGGYSGEAQTALADLYSKGAQQAGMNAWNMISPIQQGQWGAQLGANQYGADIGNQFLQNTINTQNQRNRDIWGAQTGATQAAWGQNNIADMSRWQALLGQNQWGAQNQLNQNAYPYQMAPSLWGGSVPNPVVSPTVAGNVGSSILPMALYAGSKIFGK